MSIVSLRLPDTIELYMVIVPKRLFSYAASNAEFKRMTMKEAEAHGIIECKDRPIPGLGCSWTLDVHQGVELCFKEVPPVAVPEDPYQMESMIPQGVLSKSPPAVGSRH